MKRQEQVIRQQNTNRISSIVNPVLLTSGDDGHLCNYCTKIITLELRMLCACGTGLPGLVLIIRREARTKRLSQRCVHVFDLNGNQPPQLPGVCIRAAELHLRGESVSSGVGRFVSAKNISLGHHCLYCLPINPKSAP